MEFTDIDLSTVKSIVVTQFHEPFFYSPFTTDILNPILDQSGFMIEEDFQSNKQIVFNQFMGIIAEGNPIKYYITVFGESDVLRSFEISSAMKNNIQLVFRGELLEGASKNVAFQITKNETRDGENEVSF